MILALIQSSAILLIGFAAVRLLHRQSAAMRHLVLTLTLFAAIFTPLLGHMLPEAARTSGFYERVESHTKVIVTFNPGVKRAAAGAPGYSDRFYSMVVITWTIGAVFALIVMMAGLLRIAWLVHHSKPFRDTPFLQSRRRIRLLQNQRTVLGTYGVLRPCIFLPADADQWPEERLNAVLTHEFGHVNRFDWPIQIAAELARAAYWFNPLFWALCRCLRAESEHACDDIVLNTGIHPKDYAGHLLELARTLRSPARTWAPVLAMARPPHLERRFVAMLNSSLNRKPAGRTAVVIACALALLVMLPLAAVHAGQVSQAPQTIRVAAVAELPELPESPAAPAKAPARKTAAAKPKPAQGLADGSISGTIVDQSGARVPGVAVTVLNRPVSQNMLTEAEVQTTITEQTGAFEFRGLTPGQYVVKAQLPGFSTFQSGPLQVASGQNLVENVMLSVAGVVQKVELKVIGQPRQPAPPSGRIRVGGNVIAARLVSQVKPVYPQSAHDAGIEGVVHLQGWIGTDGTLTGLTATNSFFNADLTNSAITAVSQWRYSPALLNNEPIGVPTTIDVEFKLEN